MISAASIALAASLLAGPDTPAPAEPASPGVPGEPGGPGLAILCAKALTCAEDAMVVDRAVLLVRDGRIEAVGERGELEVPEGYAIEDHGDLWVMPGMVDLHCHVGGTFDINDMVYQANPGLRVNTAVRPGNPALMMGLAAGVTTVLFIPGSGTAVGGQGVLIKTAPGAYEDILVRQPGSLKTAQGNNPKAHLLGCGPALYNWHIRDIFFRGRAYHRAWEAFEAGEGPEPARDITLDVFRDLNRGDAQVSSHTQQHAVVQSTMRIQVREFGIPTFIDHGSMDAFRGADLVAELDVPAILGPRSASWRSIGRGYDHDGRMMGIAAEYQARGHKRIGFNTDSPVIPQETLQLQAGMAVRYGLDDRGMDSVRGLTIVPAEAAGIGHRVGSLEVGKDADVLVLTGHPGDPRTSVERVYVDGRSVYDAEEERLW
ncbi:MAG: amidohydrolase family protein [Planctomycetota bacterium]